MGAAEGGPIPGAGSTGAPPATTLRRPSRALAGALAVAALATGLLAACAGSPETTNPDPSGLPPATGPSTTARRDPGPGPTSISAVVRLEPVVPTGLDQPTAMVPRPSHSELWVTEQGGNVRRVRIGRPAQDAVPAPTPDPSRTSRADGLVYDLDPQPVLSLGGLTKAGGERGLLGIAFSSDGRFVYLQHTDAQGDVVVAEYRVPADDTAPVDPATRRVLLTIPHRQYANHNGGQLELGRDGYLYVGVGDGGGSGDPDGNGQNTGVLLGKILRIDPQSRTGQLAYGIPAGNPFAKGGGAPEIFLYGARNPWRFSFDRANGDLWVADVGQDRIEEIDWLPASFGAGVGANLGWSWREGDQAFKPGTPPTGMVEPLLTYPHSGGACSVTGGYVYRGSAIPALQGVYVYGDYCVGQIRGLLARNGVVVDDRSLDATVAGKQLTSFGQGADGELFVLSGGGGLYKVVGR